MLAKKKSKQIAKSDKGAVEKETTTAVSIFFLIFSLVFGRDCLKRGAFIKNSFFFVFFTSAVLACPGRAWQVRKP